MNYRLPLLDDGPAIDDWAEQGVGGDLSVVTGALLTLCLSADGRRLAGSDTLPSWPVLPNT